VSIAVVASASLAVLIDAENAQPRVIGAVLAQLSRFAELTVKRAYGDWTSPHLKAWREVAEQHGISKVQQSRYVSGKSISDFALVIDAMDLLHMNSPDAFCLVSSDSDFGPLALRLRASGRMVVGVGQRSAPASFQAVFHDYVFTDELVGTPPAPEPADLPCPSDPFAYAAVSAIVACGGANGWAPLSAIGEALRAMPHAALRQVSLAGRLSRKLAALPNVELQWRRGANGDPTVALARLLGPVGPPRR
jgi:hypothetical protein